jgi:Flp pilus assembly protein TadD
MKQKFLHLLRYPDDARAHIFFAQTLLQVNRVEEARAKMSRAVELSPNDPVMMYNAACFYAIMGEKSLAIEYLQKAIANGFGDYEFIKHDPDFENIRGENGYLELVKEKK